MKIAEDLKSMAKSSLILISGLPGSGKSAPAETVVRELEEYRQ